MRRVAKIAIFVATVLATYLLFWPVPIEPVAWVPAPDPGLTGDFAANRRLADVEQLVPLGEGPEDVARGPDGLMYTGLQDGRVMRFDPAGGAPETFADAGGRPLGMQFDADGQLIVADAFRGLLSIAPSGKITLLADAVDEIPMVFVNDLDIAADGKIWFTDSSTRFDQHNYMLDFLESRPTGRLLSHDPATGVTRVHLEGLAFANGVALGPRDGYVVVAETLHRRIRRYWIAGERAGTVEIFIDELPGHPDNISFHDDGVFWVAMPARTFAPIESIAGRPLLRRMLLRIPGALNLPIPSFGWVLGLDTDGNVVHNLQDPGGGYSPVTSVSQIGSHLFLGSISMGAVGRLPVPSQNRN